MYQKILGPFDIWKVPKTEKYVTFRDSSFAKLNPK
jgi:hypothetical protein